MAHASISSVRTTDSYEQVDNVSNRVAYGLAANTRVRESVTKRPAEPWDHEKAGIRLQR
jgi:hypothetical protein